MAILCQLANPNDYRAFDWDIYDNPEHRAYWFELFNNFPNCIEGILSNDGLLDEDDQTRWNDYLTEYRAGIKARRDNPEKFDIINTITLCHFRQSMLDKYGFKDPFNFIKQRENQIAADLYPELIKQINNTPENQRWELLLRCLFAGNIFDMGSPKSIEMYKNGEIDFHAVLEKVPGRPWFIDDADAIVQRLGPGNRWQQVLFFVDNAGSDIALGVIPLVREMARIGIRVIVAANARPALNDITIDELNPLLAQLSKGDALLADLMKKKLITTVNSGGDLPLIELDRISEECNQAAAESDLIVLEGMGRGVESNWYQPFKCDIWRVALLKDENVAKWLGAKVFDAICRFDPAT